MPSPPVSPHTESDAEHTAELPAPDPTAHAHPGEHRMSQTDTWIAPAPPARLTEPSAPATRAAPAPPPATRATEASPPATRAASAPPPAARLTEAPPAAGAAQARQAELAQQALSAKLHEAQQLLAAKSALLTQAERARDAAYAARAAAEQRTAQLNTELGQVRAELAFQLDELTRARVQSEEQVAQSRAVLSTESARAEQLQRQLGEQESTTRTQRTLELEQRRLAEHDRTRAAGILSDLQRERERALGYLESLQSAEGRRLILEGLATELQRQVEERERDLARAARELAGRDAQARELQAELARRTARITQLEQQVSSFGATLAPRDTQLRETRHETQDLQESVARPRAPLAAGGERLRTPRARAEQHGSSDSLQQAELARLQAQHADLTAAVESARAATLATNAQAAGHAAALEALRSRNAELEATLIAERQRAGQLEDELAAARNAHVASRGTAEARPRGLDDSVAEQLEAVRVLQMEASTSAARARELEGDLRAAEDTVHRLESEARVRNARIEELEKANLQFRTAVAEARPTAPDTAANQGRDAAQAADAPAAPQPVSEGAVRVLTRHTEEGREVVHVLGRRTSIGRTPDNDLQIDSRSVSRHHAVILVGPVHSIIEDLNSTNGVYVNGRRITRNTLKDGDTVVFGQVHYRFAVRKSGDKT